jgi:ribosomal protein S6--L-glutamate ligase
LRVAILSRKPGLYSTRRLKEAGERRGHKVEIVDYLRCCMNITSHDPMVMHQGRRLVGFDAVIPRIGASHTSYGAAVVRQFELMGVFATNDAEAIVRSHDKLRCLQLLAEREIGLPATGVAHSSKDLDCLISSVGGLPLVIKLLEGSPGTGAILADTRQAAESVIEAFQELNAKSLVQKFVQEASGASLRCFVVGGRVVAAMRRQAPPGEFRSNLHRGGRAEAVKLTLHERHTAIDVAAATGLKVAGVDVLRSQHGPLVMAVNSTPELEAIEAATGVDVAGKIYKFLEDSVAPRDVREQIEV